MLANKDLNVDPQTGNPLFHPQTLTKQNKSYFASNSNIFQELYEQKDRKIRVVQHLIDKENAEIQMKSFKPLEVSNKIVQIKRRTVLEQLFSVLDSDQDGVISAETIDISPVANRKLIILAPFFCWMETNGLKFNEEQFVDEGERFTKTLDLPDIHDLFN